jgi:ABC-2 type transport system permease protein
VSRKNEIDFFLVPSVRIIIKKIAKVRRYASLFRREQLMRVIHALWIRNLKAFVRNKPAMVFNLIFPFFFVFVFRNIFTMGEIENPVTYMLAGIIIATVFDSSLRISSSTIDDMTSGFMKEVLVSPVSRLTVAIGQFLSSATVATIQGIIIFGVGFAVGLRVSSPFTVLLAIVVMVFVGLVFAGFGLFIASKAKNMQTFQAMSIAITMPMSFLSGAYIPITILPNAIQYISYFNPLTYAVSLFRAISLESWNETREEMVAMGVYFQVGNVTIGPLLALLILVAFGALFLFLSTWSFMRTDFSKMNRNKDDGLEI